MPTALSASSTPTALSASPSHSESSPPSPTARTAHRLLTWPSHPHPHLNCAQTCSAQRFAHPLYVVTTLPPPSLLPTSWLHRHPTTALPTHSTSSPPSPPTAHRPHLAALGSGPWPTAPTAPTASASSTPTALSASPSHHCPHRSPLHSSLPTWPPLVRVSAIVPTC